MAIARAQEVGSSVFRYNYQVFLSFRGEDTRKTFTDHLYTALLQAGLCTFRDDDEIERGKRLELELRKAIHGSRISIIVFSKNYASSKWCLDELVMILEWSRSGGREVLPVFYHVDPSEVRKQTGSIGKTSPKVWEDEHGTAIVMDENAVDYDRKGTQTIEGLILDMHVLKDDVRSGFKSKNTKKRRYEEFVDEPLLSNKANSLKRRYFNFLLWQSTDFSLRSPNKIELTIEGFARMDNLIFLQLNYVQLTGCYENFPQSLRWLCWHGFSLKSLPMDLPMGNLVSLDLSYSKLKRAWTGTMVLGSLKILNLSHCLQLARTPDFLGLPNLEKLILKGCLGLIEVCESIGSLQGLAVLSLEDCKNLRKFPNISKLKFLETLIIAGCSNMSEFLRDLKNVDSLKVFQADKVAINHLLPNAVRGFKLWDAFSWRWLSKPRKSVEGFWASLPHSLVNLSLADCNLSHDSFPADLCKLVSLRALDLSLNPVHRVPDCINRLRRLKVLRLDHCRRLQYIRVTNVEQLSMVESTSVKRIKYSQPTLETRTRLSYTRFLNLLEHEGVFKLEPLAKVEREMLNSLGLFNLELIRNLVVRLAFPFRYWCDIPQSLKYPTRDLPIQGLYEFGIFSTFLPKTEAPSWCSQLNKGSSISFTVPLSPNLWIWGLNVCGVYTLSNHQETWFLPPIFTKISNMTKDLNWIYKPWSLGIPAEDGEELAWLSHWKFGNQLESGDEVIISMVSDDSFEVKECGFNIVWVGQKEKETNFNTGHNLSSHQLKTGVYALSHHCVQMDHHNYLTTPRWFRELFGDSIEFEAQEASSSAFRYNYQVFLSFRGEDTRKTFTDHLYTALLQAGLRTFRDGDEIERAKRLELELRKAIHG
ncbi:hypothetical protein LguiB_017870 [Lonicera macranthoides]